MHAYSGRGRGWRRQKGNIQDLLVWGKSGVSLGAGKVVRGVDTEENTNGGCVNDLPKGFL